MKHLKTYKAYSLDEEVNWKGDRRQMKMVERSEVGCFFL